MTHHNEAPQEFTRRAFLCSAASTAALSLPIRIEDLLDEEAHV